MRENGGATPDPAAAALVLATPASTASVPDELSVASTGGPSTPRRGYGIPNLQAIRARQDLTPPRSGGLGAGSMVRNLTPPPGSGAVRAAQESAILAAVRKQMELFEDKIGVVSQEVKRQQQGDKLRETRTEMSRSIAQLRDEVHRSLAQMNGKLNGLSDNLVSQIEHVGRVDDRFQKWRGQFEGEVLMKVEQLERGHARLTTSHKSSSTLSEDSLKKYQQRLQKLEAAAEERRMHCDQTAEHIDILHQRLSDIEGSHKMVLDASTRQSTEPVVFGGAELSRQLTLEGRVDDVTERLERLSRESGDVQDIHALVAKHEQQLMAFRVQLNEHVLALGHRVQSSDVEGKLRDLQRSVQSQQDHVMSHTEKFERIEENVRNAEKNHEDLAERVMLQQRLGLTSQSVLMAQAPPSNYGGDEMDENDQRLVDGLSASVRELDERLRTTTLEAKMAADVGARLEQLVPGSQLTTQVLNNGQKLIQQEQCVTEVLERVGRLEFDIKMLRPGAGAVALSTERSPAPSPGAPAADDLAGRVMKLEEEVERLCFAVDGSSGPPELSGIGWDGAQVQGAGTTSSY